MKLSHRAWGFLPAHTTDTAQLAAARASLELRAGQSIASKWLIWAACAVTVFTLRTDLPLWVLLCWALPVMLMAEVNWRVCTHVMTGLAQADAPGLRDRQIQLWRMTAINQALMGNTVWWFGFHGDLTLAAVGTSLQMMYLSAAMINAATHPTTFISGAWINLALAILYWATHSVVSIPLVMGLLGLGAVLSRMSVQTANSFVESIGMRFENQRLLVKLEHEKQVADEATRFKSQFLSNISHEIRTPISAITSMSYLVLKSDLTAKQRKCVEMIDQCSLHLRKLINQVLDLSKIDAGMLMLEKSEFQLAKVLDNVLNMHIDNATAKDLTLSLHRQPDTPDRLLGDELRLTEVLLNFVGNAVKFTEQGSVRLTVALLAQTPQRAQLKFSVQDTGIGIEPGQMVALFKSFSQADSSTSRRYGGTGLGLAIAKALTELMEGEVGAESQPQMGSVFWCTAWFDLPAPAPATRIADTVPQPLPTGAARGWSTASAARADAASAHSEHPPGAADASAAALLCQQLAWCVAHDDPAALDLVNQHSAELKSRLGAAWERIQRALLQYDLPKAHRLLEAAGCTGAATPPTPTALSRQACASILVVDDTPTNLTLMFDLLKDEYRVRVANNGERALAIAAGPQPPDLILLDVMMPGMDGYATLGQLQANPASARIPIVFLTAKSQIEDEEKGLSLGALDYITKPVNPPIVLRRIRTQLMLKRANDFLQDKANYLEQEVQRRTAEVKDIQEVTVLALASLAETRDKETGQHILRTQRYVRTLARELQHHPRFAHYLSDAQIELLFMSAPLHDIGKVGIPDHILLKPDRLTPAEMAIMKSHTTIGRDTLQAAEERLGRPVPFLQCAKEIAHAHQEKWDGSGYPLGLVGDAIPIAARLMALADVYDALISRRVYKPAFTHEQAVRLIEAGSASHFDPDVVQAFGRVKDTFWAIALEFADPDEPVEPDHPVEPHLCAPTGPPPASV
jgi:putative two-component system response regulator